VNRIVGLHLGEYTFEDFIFEDFMFEDISFENISFEDISFEDFMFEDFIFEYPCILIYKCLCKHAVQEVEKERGNTLLPHTSVFVNTLFKRHLSMKTCG